MQLSAYPPAYPMYYAPQTAVDYHSLGKNEPTIAWLRLAIEVCEANRKPPNVAALRTNNVLCLSGARETQIASAIEGFPHTKASWQAFSAAFLAAAGDDQQSLAAVRYQRFSFRANVAAGAQININAFRSMVNDGLAVDTNGALEIDLGGAKRTLARQIRRQYVMGCRETNSELYNHLQKPDTQERPLKHLYKATPHTSTSRPVAGRSSWSLTARSTAPSRLRGAGTTSSRRSS